MVVVVAVAYIHIRQRNMILLDTFVDQNHNNQEQQLQ
jgi:hypothetical protein